EHHQSNRRSCFCVSRDSVKNLFFACHLPAGQCVAVVGGCWFHKICVGWVFAISPKNRYRRRH
ncbi:hypothetical protein, partial [Pseudomonas sp. BC115LW]|uniref:hypothetical protein n=1 Tax=Pseudomonas sp. BC115LW TaxID=2683267 RepID=UPI001C499DE2